MKTLPNTFLLTILLKKKQFTVFSILDQTHRLTPSKIFDVCDLSKINFYSLKLVVYRLKHYQIHFFSLFCPKGNSLQFSNFWPKSWVNPFWKILILPPFKNSLYVVYKRFFFPDRILPNTLLWPILSSKKGFAKCPIFDQNLELTPLTNSNFAIFQKSTFLLSRKACFPYKRLPKHFVDLFWPKRKKLKLYNFEPKPLENPFF